MYVQKIKRWCIMSDTLKRLNQIAAILELATIATLKLIFQYSIIK